MSNPLISILIPFKDTAKFLPECLQSIIVQSYSNWELLIVDDNSSDDSYGIVEQFSEKICQRGTLCPGQPPPGCA